MDFYLTARNARIDARNAKVVVGCGLWVVSFGFSVLGWLLDCLRLVLLIANR